MTAFFWDIPFVFDFQTKCFGVFCWHLKPHARRTGGYKRGGLAACFRNPILGQDEFLRQRGNVHIFCAMGNTLYIARFAYDGINTDSRTTRSLDSFH